MPKVWTCPTCAKGRRMRFCPQCGEERLRPDDLSLRDLLAQFLKNTSSIDGKLVRSWRTLLTRPGRLTAAHIGGERRWTMNPVTLFFLANAVFVAMQSVTGVNVLSSPLSSHLHSQDWSAFAQSLIGQRLVERNLTLEAYAPVFDRMALFNAKALIILMALAFAPLPAVIFRGRHLPAGAHIVFALHLYAFVLLVLSVSVLLAEADILLGGQGLSSGAVDNVLSILNLLACGAYIYFAIPKVYSANGWLNWASAIVMTFVMAFLFVGYRFVIFLITFYTT
jgi:Protein of unknown function (DUF3667).